MTRYEILDGVRECVAVVVNGEPESIGPDDRIIDDLGADSLDLLDLVFQLQQRFGVIISPRGIERRAEEALGGTPLAVNGVYTPEALAELRRALPEIPPAELGEGLRVADLPRLFRVATMVSLVSGLLEEAT